MNIIAIPTKDNKVDDHFGHCDFFTIIRVDSSKRVVSRTNMESSKACGCKTNLAEDLAKAGVSILLAGGIGQGAINKLKGQNIQVLAGFKGSVEEAIENWKNNNFFLDIPICTDHHDCEN
jgi:predicted Fe-Mo cluster-binding NifX family protein